jgi:acetyl esterase/lipase
VTYTPPTAKQQFVGDLCIPKKQKRTIILLVHGGGGVMGSKEWIKFGLRQVMPLLMSIIV